LREALAAGRPAVVDVACAPDAIAPGLSLDAMLGAR
jgi:hypothetical protein